MREESYELTISRHTWFAYGESLVPYIFIYLLSLVAAHHMKQPGVSIFKRVYLKENPVPPVIAFPYRIANSGSIDMTNLNTVAFGIYVIKR